jgi:hypothetical protein
MIVQVAEVVAALHSLPVEVVCERTYRNSIELFHKNNQELTCTVESMIFKYP